MFTVFQDPQDIVQDGDKKIPVLILANEGLQASCPYRQPVMYQVPKTTGTNLHDITGKKVTATEMTMAVMHYPCGQRCPHFILFKDDQGMDMVSTCKNTFPLNVELSEKEVKRLELGGISMIESPDKIPGE